jgi:hypothetical protein
LALDPGLLQAAQKVLASNPAATQLQGKTAPDWRVKLSLAPGANYLYKNGLAGILYPLYLTDGVIFPYTPKIDMSYSADYDAYNLTHTNYTGYFYKHSKVSEINISCDFTAQNSSDARYLLAVIHFFRSVTKMFYGQDNNPVAGTPPPVCFLDGLGQYQFNKQPVLVSSFNYSLPGEVDYIRAGDDQYVGGQTNLQSIRNPTISAQGGVFDAVTGRLINAGLDGIKNLFSAGNGGSGGGITSLLPTSQGTESASSSTNVTGKPTYVPTKMTINITLLPVISRLAQAQKYSTSAYAAGGGLTQGKFW